MQSYKCQLAGMPNSEPTSALTALALGNDNDNRLRACWGAAAVPAVAGSK